MWPDGVDAPRLGILTLAALTVVKYGIPTIVRTPFAVKAENAPAYEGQFTP